MRRLLQFAMLLGVAAAMACARGGVHDPVMRGLLADLPPATYAIFHTTQGDFVVHLFVEKAPRTTTNFIGLAEGVREFTDPVTHTKMKRPYYDGVMFYRIIKDGLIETGDRTDTDQGGTGYFFDDEFVPELKHDKVGVLSMGTDGPNTNQSQFAIALRLRPDLDMHYSVFGEIVRGVEVAQRIGALPVVPPPAGVRRSERPAAPEPRIQTLRIYRIESDGAITASPPPPDIDIRARPGNPGRAGGG